MSDFEDKLSGILNSPETMAQIMQLAQSFSASEKTVEVPKSEPENTGIDPNMIMMLTKLMGEFSAPDKCSSLLSAVEPYLRQERREKVEKAMKIARIAKIAKKALGEMGGGSLV